MTKNRFVAEVTFKYAFVNLKRKFCDYLSQNTTEGLNSELHTLATLQKSNSAMGVAKVISF